VDSTCCAVLSSGVYGVPEAVSNAATYVGTAALLRWYEGEASSARKHRLTVLDITQISILPIYAREMDQCGPVLPGFSLQRGGTV